MNRRSVLAALGLGLGSLTGCTGTPTGGDGTETPRTDTMGTDESTSCGEGEEWNPDVDVERVELAPGERTTFDVRVGPITSFNFDGDLYGCGPDNGAVEFGEVEIDPDPDRQGDPCPPYWIWEACTTVDLRIPVEAEPDADSGEYRFGFTVSGGHNRSRGHRGVVVVTAP